jgi:putative ABC transport system permease protein
VSAEYYDLSYWQVAVGALLILVNAGISLVLRLDLERRLMIASLRTIVQLLAVGFLLQWIFQQKHWVLTVLWMLMMSGIAGISAVGRVDRRYTRMTLDSITAVMLSSWMLTVISLTLIIHPSAWKDQPAQYAIPFMGLILGNTLNGISLGLNRFTESLTQDRDLIEMKLTLGATRWEAARHSVRVGVRTGMIPTINAMMVVGLVSLPGIMTGQLLAGVSPVAAVKYQIVIMFLIGAGTATGTILVILLGYRRMFNHRHQFLAEKISPVK